MRQARVESPFVAVRRFGLTVRRASRRVGVVGFGVGSVQN